MKVLGDPHKVEWDQLLVILNSALWTIFILRDFMGQVQHDWFCKGDAWRGWRFCVSLGFSPIGWTSGVGTNLSKMKLQWSHRHMSSNHGTLSQYLLSYWILVRYWSVLSFQSRGMRTKHWKVGENLCLE